MIPYIGALLIGTMWAGAGILIGVLCYVLTERDPEEITTGRMVFQTIVTMVWGALGALLVLGLRGVI